MKTNLHFAKLSIYSKQTTFPCILLLLLLSCKKNNLDTKTTTPSNNNKAIIFTNGTDPRLAEIETNDNTRVVFFGERNFDGSPRRLSSYTVSNLTDSTNFNIVTLDSLGRYSNLIVKTGERVHFDYSIPDSVGIIISGKDSVTNQLLYRVAKSPSMHNTSLLQRSKILTSIGITNSERIEGADENVNIKVTAKNNMTQTERDLQGEQTSVIVNIHGGSNHDYSLMANYNAATGIYYVPLKAAGYSFSNSNAIDKTLSMIKDALDIACTNPNSGDSLIDKSVPELFKEVVCALAGPEAEILCHASKILLIACNVSTAYDILAKVKEATYSIDPNSIPIGNDAIVNATSQSYRFGTATSNQLTVSQILLNPTNYDLKITHSYTPKLPFLLTSKITSVASNSAVAGGDYIDDGGGTITAKGVCWSTSNNPTIALPTKTNEGPGAESFISNISGLTPNKTYYVRAYATNSIGTAYGNEISFITLKSSNESLSGNYSGYAIWTNYDGTGQDPEVDLNFSIAVDQNGVLSGSMTIDGHTGVAVGSVSGNSITIGWTTHDAPFKYAGTFSADKKTIQGSGGAGDYYAPFNANGPFKVSR